MSDCLREETGTSIELWLNEATSTIECQWGVIENPEGRPDLGMRHLILVSDDWARALCKQGPMRDRYGTLCSVQNWPVGTFTAERDGQRWVWELFDCHWADEQLPPRVYVGRWMD